MITFNLIYIPFTYMNEPLLFPNGFHVYSGSFISCYKYILKIIKNNNKMWQRYYASSCISKFMKNQPAPIYLLDPLLKPKTIYHNYGNLQFGRSKNNHTSIFKIYIEKTYG